METSVSVFPTKEQAIVLNTIDGLILSDYVVAIGDIVTPNNVIFASRLSNERICIYLSNKSYVDQIVSEYVTVTIKGKPVNVRRLINPAKRIILSNVCPSIPHSALEDILKRTGFSLVSKMGFLRAGISNEEYSHVLSFRRHVYVQPNESVDLPPSVVIKYDDTNYRIFLAYDDICFKCRLAGHFAQNCPSVKPVSTDDATTSLCENSIAKDIESQKSDPNQSTASTNKRPTTDDTDTEKPDRYSPASSKASETEILLRHSKKIKHSDSTESLTPISDLLRPGTDLIENAQYPLSFNELTEFVEKAVGEIDILALIRNYTEDIEALQSMLYDVFPLLTHRSIQNRVKKIRRKINKALDANPHTKMQPQSIDHPAPTQE